MLVWVLHLFKRILSSLCNKPDEDYPWPWLYSHSSNENKIFMASNKSSKFFKEV
jgi:hypothetical protein